jgi:hypothetical protein
VQAAMGAMMKKDSDDKKKKEEKWKFDLKIVTRRTVL